MNMVIKYFSMFSGIGGFELGMERSKHNFEAIGFSEVDNFAISVYSRHFPRHKNYGDATKINPKELDDFTLLIGGFPCQAFSLAGSRRGFEDARGTLFFELARILAAKKPRYFLFENVKGLLSHDGGRTFHTIIRICDQLGYDVSWQIYNSSNYGVAQNRERIYLKGYSRSECGSEILSDQRTSTEANAPRSDKFDSEYFVNVGMINGFPNGNTAQIDANYSKGLSPSDVRKNQRRRTHIIEAHLKLKTNTIQGFDEAYPCDGVRLDHPNGNTGRGRVQKDLVGALTTGGNWGTVDHDFLIRRLTPRECERLQGFPDDWTLYGKDGEEISDTQRYKMCGNAVTVNVIQHIFDNWNLKV